jgi:hypothetical protein
VPIRCDTRQKTPAITEKINRVSVAWLPAARRLNYDACERVKPGNHALARLTEPPRKGRESFVSPLPAALVSIEAMSSRALQSLIILGCHGQLVRADKLPPFRVGIVLRCGSLRGVLVPFGVRIILRLLCRRR